MASNLGSLNKQILLKLLLLAILMFGFGYALVPLYKALCEVTGINVVTRASRIRTELIPEEELALQREYNVGNYLLSLERPERTVMRVQDIDLYGLDASFYRTYAKRMAAVTPALARETAERHVKPGAAYVVVVGEAKEIRAELEKFGALTVYDVDLNVKR